MSNAFVCKVLLVVVIGAVETCQLMLFCCWQGGLSVNYSDNYYHLSQRHPDVPRLTQQHHEAMALFNEIASSDALRMDSMLQPGDIQLLNNHTQLHTRAEFEDFTVSICSHIVQAHEVSFAPVAVYITRLFSVQRIACFGPLHVPAVVLYAATPSH